MNGIRGTHHDEGLIHLVASGLHEECGFYAREQVAFSCQLLEVLRHSCPNRRMGDGLEVFPGGVI